MAEIPDLPQPVRELRWVLSAEMSRRHLVPDSPKFPKVQGVKISEWLGFISGSSKRVEQTLTSFS